MALATRIHIRNPQPSPEAPPECRWSDAPPLDGIYGPTPTPETAGAAYQRHRLPFRLPIPPPPEPLPCTDDLGEVPPNGALVIYFTLDVLTDPIASATDDTPSNGMVSALLPLQIVAEPTTPPNGGTSDVPSNGTVI